mmetsp:Transcript_41903/g.40231  ORF Transcript_41903/g.40231 Transcript_41903/m.40231 type:complete len:86 (-) Transcript_41903:1178-1435(-)
MKDRNNSLEQKWGEVSGAGLLELRAAHAGVVILLRDCLSVPLVLILALLGQLHPSIPISFDEIGDASMLGVPLEGRLLYLEERLI